MKVNDRPTRNPQMIRFTFCTFNDAFVDKPILISPVRFVFSSGTPASFPVLSDIFTHTLKVCWTAKFLYDEGLESAHRAAVRCSCLVVAVVVLVVR